MTVQSYYLYCGRSCCCWFQLIHDAGFVRTSALKETPLIGVILSSWFIAFIKYAGGSG